MPFVRHIKMAAPRPPRGTGTGTGTATTTITTPRLVLTEFCEDEEGDAAFVLALLNTPGFLANIGDRHVRSAQDAQRYIREGPARSFACNGAGLMKVSLRDTGEAVGMCGLVFRSPAIPHPDVGFAVLPEFMGRGIATEAAEAAIAHFAPLLRLEAVMGVVVPTNAPSIRVLEKLGLGLLEERRLAEGAEVLCIFHKSIKQPP